MKRTERKKNAVLFSGRIGGRKTEIRAVSEIGNHTDLEESKQELHCWDSRCFPLPDGVLVETVLTTPHAGGRTSFRVQPQFGGASGRSAWMVDASGSCSDRVLVECRRGMGSDTVSLVPDVGWLRSPERNFPVRLQWGLYPKCRALLLFDADAGKPDGTVSVDGDGVPVRICRSSGSRQKGGRILRVTLPCLHFPLPHPDGAYRLCLCRTKPGMDLHAPEAVAAVGSPDVEAGDCVLEIPEYALSDAAVQGFRLRLCREEKTGYVPAPADCRTAIRLPSGIAIPMTGRRSRHFSEAFLPCGGFGPFGICGIHPGTGAFAMRFGDGFADPALSLPIRLCYSSADRFGTERIHRAGDLGYGWCLKPESGGFFARRRLGRQYRPGYSGRKVTSLTDRNGRRWLLDYGGDRLVSVTAPNGGKTEFLYEAVPAQDRSESRLSGIVYPNGAVIGVTYCADVPSMITLSGPNIGHCPTTRVEWDGCRRVRRICTVTPDAKRETNAYGAPRLIPSAWTAFRYLPTGVETCRYETDENGRTDCVFRKVWHPSDRLQPDEPLAQPELPERMQGDLTVVTDPSGRICEAEAPNGGSLVCRRNGFGDPVQLARGDGLTVTLYADAFRNRTGVSVGWSQLVNFTYRPQTNRLLQARYANGQSVWFRYDRRGNLSQVEESRSSGAAVCVERNGYDARNRLICREDLRNGLRMEWLYDGELLSEYLETSADDGENRRLFGIRYRYDTCGTLREKRYLLPGGVNWSDRGYVRRACRTAEQAEPETALREPDPVSSRDGYGNLLLKNGVIFRYGDTEWHDLLTDYGDVPIPHDAIGNPTELCGEPLVWERGTRLASFGQHLYRYRSDGLRIGKTENGRRHRYFYDGDRLIAEQIGNAYSGDPIRLLLFLYDRGGTVCGFRDGREEYRLLRNAAGDVAALLDAAGNAVARYAYDPYGETLSVTDADGRRVLRPDHPGNVNPFRFRGHYCDTETGLYCIRGRFYFPKLGRYLSPDVDGLAGLHTFPQKWNLFML